MQLPGFMYRAILLLASATALTTAGCAVRGEYAVEGSGPDLVYAAPGVQVIADYDEPVFYADNFYWRQDGGTWYRSHDYRGGWVTYSNPPSVVVHIDQPSHYAHYHPAGHTPVVRDHRPAPSPGPVVRDHRAGPTIPPQRATTPPPPSKKPVVRDHRRGED